MKSKFLLLFLLFTALSSHASAQAVAKGGKPAASAQKSEYVGYQFVGVNPEGTLPNGVKSLGGGILDGAGGRSYALHRVSKGATQMLWLDLGIAEVDSGKPEWEVKDVLTFPALKQSDEVIYYSGICEKNKKTLPATTVVLANFNRRASAYKVLKAWNVNLKTEKFEPASIAGIKCFYVTP